MFEHGFKMSCDLDGPAHNRRRRTLLPRVVQSDEEPRSASACLSASHHHVAQRLRRKVIPSAPVSKDTRVVDNDARNEPQIQLLEGVDIVMATAEHHWHLALAEIGDELRDKVWQLFAAIQECVGSDNNRWDDFVPQDQAADKIRPSRQRVDRKFPSVNDPKTKLLFGSASRNWWMRQR